MLVKKRIWRVLRERENIVNKFFAIASFVASSMVACQADFSEACDSCRPGRYYHHTETVLVDRVVPSTVIVTPSAPAPAVNFYKPRAIKVPQGSVLRLKANFLGHEPGQVFLQINSTTHPCEVIEWNPSFVIIHMPNFAAMADTPGKIMIATNDGKLKRKIDVIVAPTEDVAVIPNDEFIPKAPTELIWGP